MVHALQVKRPVVRHVALLVPWAVDSKIMRASLLLISIEEFALCLRNGIRYLTEGETRLR